MKIGTKINLILIAVFLCGLVVSGTAISNVLYHKAENEVNAKALALMQIANSVRTYTNNRVQPYLLPKLDTEEKFYSVLTA